MLNRRRSNSLDFSPITLSTGGKDHIEASINNGQGRCSFTPGNHIRTSSQRCQSSRSELCSYRLRWPFQAFGSNACLGTEPQAPYALKKASKSFRKVMAACRASGHWFRDRTRLVSSFRLLRRLATTLRQPNGEELIQANIRRFIEPVTSEVHAIKRFRYAWSKSTKENIALDAKSYNGEKAIALTGSRVAPLAWLATMATNCFWNAAKVSSGFRKIDP